MEPGAKLKVSFKLFALNVVGAILAAIGVMILQQPAMVAMLPWSGWILLLIGILLMAWFMVDIFKRIRAAQSARYQQETR